MRGLAGKLLNIWACPASLWGWVQARLTLVTRVRLACLARWNGTRLQMVGAVHQGNPVIIQGRGMLRIAAGTVLGYRLAGYPGQPILLQPRSPHAEIVLGEGCQIMNGCQFIALEKIVVGARSSIGAGCLFLDSDGHELDPTLRNESGKSAPILLGENVWVGGRVIILKGVCVGQDAVIAAGSVVARDVPAGGIAAGVPARVIGSVYA